MRRTKWPIPPHEIRIEQLPPLLTSIELYVDGRLVASTTLGIDATADSEDVRDFVLAYFHMPSLNTRKRKKPRRPV